jgi:hypothetical protein
MRMSADIATMMPLDNARIIATYCDVHDPVRKYLARLARSSHAGSHMLDGSG